MRIYNIIQESAIQYNIIPYNIIQYSITSWASEGVQAHLPEEIYAENHANNTFPLSEAHENNINIVQYNIIPNSII